MVTPVPDAVKSGSPTLFKRRIALELKQRRKDAKLTQKDAAKRLDRTQQHIGNIESSIRLPTTGDLELLLDLYEVPERITFMRELLSAAKKGRSWWTAFSGAVPEWFDLYLGLESGAAEISTFETYLVPGLLQTRDYIKAVVRGDPDLSDEEVQSRAEVRLTRQRILDREEDPVRLWALIDELALYRERGSSEVMAAQLDHLITMSERPRIDIQILPRKAGAHLAQQGAPFSLLKFPADWIGDPGVVCEDTLAGSRYLEEPDMIAVYDRAITRLQAIAANPEESRAILQRARKEV